MRKLIIPFVFLLALEAPRAYADAGPCRRKIAVRASSESDPNFNARVFLERFRKVLQSSGVELSEDFDHPEYVLAATFEKEGGDPPETYLGITLGYVDGDVGSGGGSRGYPYFPHYTDYYGYLIDSAWTLAPGNSVSDHLDRMAAEFAAKGGLEKLMREFEQIPVKAQAELDKKFYADDSCAENGEKRFINVSKFESGYPKNTSYSDEVRVVAQVEKGDILNGEPLSGNDKFRVYTYDATQGFSGLVCLDYRAPDEGDSDKLIVYNSCVILDEKIEPLKDTVKKDVILTFDIPICFAWEGTIEHRWTAEAAKGESLLTTILPGGEYRSAENWRLRVKFRKDRGNEDVEVFGLQSARLELFEEKLDATVMDMQKEDRSIEVDMQESASARWRALSPKECDLELAVNKKRGTYVLSGGLHVKGIRSVAQSKLEQINAPVDQKSTDSGRGTVEINQPIELSGSLPAGSPENIRGKRDVMNDLAPDAREFLKAMGGEQTKVFRWDLVKRKELLRR